LFLITTRRCWQRPPRHCM